MAPKHVTSNSSLAWAMSCTQVQCTPQPQDRKFRADFSALSRMGTVLGRIWVVQVTSFTGLDAAACTYQRRYGVATGHACLGGFIGNGHPSP